MSNYVSCQVNVDFIQYRNIVCQLPLSTYYLSLCDRIEELRQQCNIVFYCIGFSITIQLLQRYLTNMDITNTELLVLMVIAYKYSYPDNCTISWSQISIYSNMEYHNLLQLEIDILKKLQWFIIPSYHELTICNCKCVYCSY